MTGWLIFAGYMLASALTGRALLRIIMTRPICQECREGWFTGKCLLPSRHSGLYGTPRKVAPLGEVMERPIGLAVLATIAGLAWPLTGLVAIVIRARPTPDEMARRNAEMTDRIRDLERQINEGDRR